jgi:glycerol-3-phosphate cytidylyltransferase
MTSTSKTVITYGTFDLFHIGHLNLLKQCRKLGDRLIVGISTDEFNTIKGKQTVVPFEERAQIVAGMRFVDDVFPESNWEQKRFDIQKFGAHTFVMGDDWKGQFDFLLDLCEVVYLPRTPGISSTSLKDALRILQAIDLART